MFLNVSQFSQQFKKKFFKKHLIKNIGKAFLKLLDKINKIKSNIRLKKFLTIYNVNNEKKLLRISIQYVYLSLKALKLLKFKA